MSSWRTYVATKMHDATKLSRSKWFDWVNLYENEETIKRAMKIATREGNYHDVFVSTFTSYEITNSIETKGSSVLKRTWYWMMCDNETQRTSTSLRMNAFEIETAFDYDAFYFHAFDCKVFPSSWCETVARELKQRNLDEKKQYAIAVAELSKFTVVTETEMIESLKRNGSGRYIEEGLGRYVPYASRYKAHPLYDANDDDEEGGPLLKSTVEILNGKKNVKMSSFDAEIYLRHLNPIREIERTINEEEDTEIVRYEHIRNVRAFDNTFSLFLD